MSSVNNLEPQAFGLILFKTTFGDLEVELFTKQCPKLTRNFVQLCLDGYYEGTIFDRVEKDFIAIGGTRQDDLEDDRLSDHLEHHKDEFNSRLRFTRRGLLATANTEKNSNGPGFFFTLNQTPELQNKHSIFGRLRGNSVYCLVDLNDSEVDDDFAPLIKKEIMKCEILKNPFSDLQPRLDVVAQIKVRRDSTVINKKPKVEPKLDIKSDKKLSFFQEDTDEGESDDEQSNHDLTERRKESSYLQKVESPVSLKKETDQLSCAEGQDSKRIKLADEDKQKDDCNPDEVREKRLREIRAEIQSIKMQFDCASATKIRTLSERRNLKRQSEESPKDTEGKQESKLSRSSLDKKPRRNRERETMETIQSFKRKLEQISKEHLDLKNTDARRYKKSGSSRMHDDTGQIDEEDARLNEELQLIDDDDAWLAHKFETSNSDSVNNSTTNAGEDTKQGHQVSDGDDSLRGRLVNLHHHRSSSPSRSEKNKHNNDRKHQHSDRHHRR